jgi:hypothetical protein
MRTITRETVALLTASFGRDFWPQGERPSGFVRVPGTVTESAYISTADAVAEVLAGRLDPKVNLERIHMEDARRDALLEAPLLAQDAKLERDKETAQAAAHARYLARVEREAKVRAQNELAMAGDAGIRKA